MNWLENACSEKTIGLACSGMDYMMSKEMVADNICCPPGERLDKEKMRCGKASVEDLIGDMLHSINSTRAFSPLEKSAKEAFFNSVINVWNGLYNEDSTMQATILEQMKQALQTLFDGDWKAIDETCANPGDEDKNLCDYASSLKKKFQETIDGGSSVDQECGPDQLFDMTMVKCVDKDLFDIGMKIMSVMKEEGRKSDDETEKSISTSVADGLTLVLQAMKAGHSNEGVLDTLTEQSGAMAKQVASLCINADEDKVPYCKLIRDFSDWFDRMINKKSPCKVGQPFHEDMTRVEIQCLDLDFVDFIKQMIQSQLTSTELDPKSIEGKIMAALDKAMEHYKKASEDTTRTTKQRQEDFIKGLQQTVQDTTAGMGELCKENPEDESGLEKKSCDFITGVAKELGMAANNQNSCNHGQIFDFSLLKCIDVMVMDFGLELLQMVDELIDSIEDPEDANLVRQLKTGLVKIMEKFRAETIKSNGAEGADKSANLDAFVGTLKSEIKQMIERVYPKCPIQNPDRVQSSLEEVAMDDACKMAHDIAKYYMQLLDDSGATQCPAGKIFDVEILSCVDMHIVSFAEKILGLLESKEISKIENEEEKTIFSNLIKNLKAFIAKTKQVSLATDTSEVKLMKMKDHGRDEMINYLRSLNALCSTSPEGAICSKALVLSEHVARFIFDKLFTEGCGLHEFFDLSILKCVHSDVYDSMSAMLNAIKADKAESETEQVIKESAVTITISFVNNVKRQAGSTAPIDVFEAIGNSMQAEVKSIFNMVNGMCKDVKPEGEEDGDFTQFQMCTLVRNVARSLAAISDKSLLDTMGTNASSLAPMPPKHCAHWDESILDCLDNHFVEFLHTIVLKIQSLDEELKSTSSPAGKLFYALNKVMEIWKKGDMGEGVSHQQLFERFLYAKEDGLKDIMDSIKGICEYLTEGEPGTTEHRINDMICSSWLDMAANFGYNLATHGSGDHHQCAKGQILDVDLLKCVDIIFLDMAKKMMSEMKSNRNLTDEGSLESKVASSVEKFVAALMKEAQDMGKSASEKQHDLLKKINKEANIMMNSMKEYCSQHTTDPGSSFDYKMCAQMSKLGEAITRANLEFAEADLTTFVNGSLGNLNQISGNPQLKEKMQTALIQLHGNLHSIHEVQVASSGSKKAELLDKENIEAINEEIRVMCEDDPEARICLKLTENFQKYWSIMNTVCDNEFEVFDKSLMKCIKAKSVLEFFDSIFATLNKLTGITDIKTEELHMELKPLAGETVRLMQAHEGRKDYGEILSPLEGRWMMVLGMRDRACPAIENKVGANKEQLVCKIVAHIDQTVSKLLGGDDHEGEMCDHLRVKADMRICGDDEQFCIDGNRCIPKDEPCDMFEGKM